MRARRWLHSLTDAVQGGALCLTAPAVGPVPSRLSTLLTERPAQLNRVEEVLLRHLLADAALHSHLHRADPTVLFRLLRDEDPCGVFMDALEGRPQTRGDGDPISKVRRYIDSHYRSALPLATLSGEVGISSTYLSDRFHRRVGCTIRQYIAGVRVDAAKPLLHEGTKVEAVALLVGYRNRSHFTRQFKRLVGMTPSQFRSGWVRAS